MAWELTKVLQLPTGAFQLESVFKIIVGLHLSDWQASFSALAQTCLLNQNADRWHTSDLQLQTVLLICRYSVMRGPMIHQEKFKNTRGTLTRLLREKKSFSRGVCRSSYQTTGSISHSFEDPQTGRSPSKGSCVPCSRASVSGTLSHSTITFLPVQPLPQGPRLNTLQEGWQCFGHTISECCLQVWVKGWYFGKVPLLILFYQNHFKLACGLYDCS